MERFNRAQPRVDTVGSLPLAARNATLADLVTILRDQHGRKVDVVAPSSAIRADFGTWVVDGAEPIIDADGVAPGDGRYNPTDHADGNIADRLQIPRAYLRRLRTDRPDLYDANINGWLHGESTVDPTSGEMRRFADPTPDPRSFLVRAFRGDNGTGVARALLSDRYRIVDNLDVLTSALDGVRDAGVDVEIEAADLTETRMMVRVACPAVHELAPDLLADYRSPFTGATGADNPVISAGLVIGNSEVGGGALTIGPRLRVEVCQNGMAINRDAIRHVHLGGRMDDGVIRWSDDTQQRNLDLIRAQTRDAVATFLDVDYVRAKITEMRRNANTVIDKPADAVTSVAKALKIPTEHTDAILAHFVAGAQPSAMGLVNAVTSVAQTVDNADTAADMEAAAVDVLTVI